MKSFFAAAAAFALVPSAVYSQEVSAIDEVESAQFDQRAADVVAALRGDLAYDAVFNAGFRAQVPEAQFSAIAGQLESQFGPMIGLEASSPSSATSGTIQIRFERGLASANMNIEAAGPYLVNGLLLTGVEPINDSVDSLLEDVVALPGEASLLATRIGADEPLFAHNSDMPLALGSTFKLYVLSALAHAVEAGQYSWEDTVPLSVRSYPSGIMQDWPEGAQVTLHTLATLMISISDNTATDQLIAVLGREAVEAEVAAAGHANPALMRPMMTTRELFVLKSEDGFDGSAYLALSESERRDRLDSLADEERSLSEILAAFTGGPNNIDVEWLASGEDIAALMARLSALEDPTARNIMGVSPGIAGDMTEDWAYIGYKGGSEPGVLNMSWLLRSRDGEYSVVTVGWNNPETEVDLSVINGIGMRAIALLR